MPLVRRVLPPSRENGRRASHASTARDGGASCQICQLRGLHKDYSEFCVTCNLPLCTACARQHGQMKVTSAHNVISRKDKANESGTCPLHRFAELQYFCESCTRLICVNCTFLDHKGHGIVDATDAVRASKDRLEGAVTEVEHKLAAVTSELRVIDDLEARVEQIRDRTRNDMQIQLNLLQAKQKRQHEDLLGALDAYVEGRLEFLDKKRKTNQQKQDVLLGLRESAVSGWQAESGYEKLVTGALRYQTDVTNIRVDGPTVNTDDFSDIQFVLTSNEEFGVLEQTDQTLMPLEEHETQSVSLTAAPSIDQFDEQHATKSRLSKQGSGYSNSGSSYSNRGFTKSTKGTFAHNTPAVPFQLPAINKSSSKIFGQEHSTLPTVVEHQTKEEAEVETHGKAAKIVSKFKLHGYVKRPSGLLVHPSGRFVIADAAADGVLICDRTGRFQQRMFADEISGPCGLAFGPDGEILVATRTSLKTFRLDGTKLREVEISSDAMSRDQDGNFAVADGRQVTLYDADVQQTQQFAMADEDDPDPYIIASSAGKIALSFESQVRVFNDQGDVLLTSDLTGRCHGVDIDRSGNLYVACDELVHIPLASRDLVPVCPTDKSGKPFRLTPRLVRVGANRRLYTLHVSPINRRAELVVLQIAK